MHATGLNLSKGETDVSFDLTGALDQIQRMGNTFVERTPYRVFQRRTRHGYGDDPEPAKNLILEAVGSVGLGPSSPAKPAADGRCA